MSPDPLKTALVAPLQPLRRETAGHPSVLGTCLTEKGLLGDANVPRSRILSRNLAGTVQLYR